MPHFKCYPISDPNSQWEYCPNYGAAISFCVFFGITAVAHILQAIILRKPFAAVIVMGAAWETAGYGFRIMSVRQEENSTYSDAQSLLILLAPLWINAFIYMILGRMVHFYLDRDRIFGIRARRITLMFVLFDIASFIVQAIGGVMAQPSQSISVQHTGLHVYIGGVGIQVFFICIFLTLAIQFQRLVKKESFYEHMPPSDGNEEASSSAQKKSARQAVRLCYVLYGTLALIIYRNIYRLVEFSAGVHSSITMHEWYAYVFDALPMLAARVVLNVFHPGHVLRGPRSDFSEQNKELKEEKKA